MSKFYFFTNSGVLDDQNQFKAYGPVNNYENSKFRVTSVFSASDKPKAYAVCNGKIFAQEVNGKINLVIKPTVCNP